MLTADDFRRIALGLPGAVEGAHMGHPDFRASGRIFATLHTDLQSGMVKLTPGQQERFVAEEPGAFAPENGAWGRQGCTRVRLASVDEETLGEAMTLAWQNAAAASTARRSSPKQSARRAQSSRRG
jgi:hypothetical protein